MVDVILVHHDLQPFSSRRSSRHLHGPLVHTPSNLSLKQSFVGEDTAKGTVRRVVAPFAIGLGWGTAAERYGWR